MYLPTRQLDFNFFFLFLTTSNHAAYHSTSKYLNGIATNIIYFRLLCADL